MKDRLLTLLVLLVLSGPMVLQAQLIINQATTPQQMVENILLGGGVTAFNVTYAGNANARGSFITGNSNLGLASGVILSSGRVQDASGNANNFASTAHLPAPPTDPDLAALSGQTIRDRAILEFDFIPTGDTLRFRYIFASEEYPEFVCSQFNDAFGFFLSGPGITGPFSNNSRNLALIPGTNTPITINTINSGNPGGGYSANVCASANPNWQANSVYYVNNAGGATVAYDGFTTIFTAFALVQCGQTYHIKLAIGDGVDQSYDSAVFLEAGSFTSTGQVQPTLANGLGVSGDTMLEGCGPYELIFQRVGDLSVPATVSLSAVGTAVAGVDYSPAIPDEIYFDAWQETVSILIDVPPLVGGQRTLVINVQQLIQCAGVVIQEQYTFLIDNPPPINVVATNINGICGQTHVLAPGVSGGMGQYTYLWSTGATSPSITVSPTVTTTYSLTVSDVCQLAPFTADITVTLPIYPPLELEVSPPTEVQCLGTGPIGVVSITGGDNVFSYQWTLDGAVVGTTPTITVPASPPLWYILTVTDGCGSSITDSVLVSTAALPGIEITTAGDVTVICPGDSAVIAVTGITGGNGVYTLAWTDQSGTVISNNDSVQVWVPANHTYTISVDDQCGYSGTATVTTRLPVYDPFRLSLTRNLTVCAGDSAVLHALVTGGSGYYHVEWEGLDHTDPVLVVGPLERTEYTVTITDQCGAQLIGSVVVDVEYVFTSIEVTNRGQDDWYLQAATTPFAERWLWDMGDGTRYRGKEVFHSYLNLEEHWVYLWITTPNGCHGMDSVLLRPPAHFYFPNAFTPDGDGINDFFGPVGHYIEDFEMTIFDRWGNEVFTTNQMTRMWDGLVGGMGRPITGVYVYKYRAVGHLFPSVEGYGHVTLLAGGKD